jgi:ubiquitin-conjugating enzyme E2 variant
MDLAGTLLKVAVTWLVVDWISGFVHWCEDSYGSPSTPFLGRRITEPNLRHHFKPRSFVDNSWFASSELLLWACAAALVVAWSLGRLSPMVVLAAVLGANANQVHKWSHRSETENGPVIAALQRLRLLQSPRHHQQHHLGRKDSHYCVLTNVLNPVLDRSRFWKGLELVLERAFGLKKRDDDAMLAAVLREAPDFLGRASR